MPLSDKMPLKPGGINPFGPTGPNYIVPPPLSRVERIGRTITEGLDRARRTVRPNNLNRALAAGEPARGARVGRSVLGGAKKVGKYVATAIPPLVAGGITAGVITRAIFEQPETPKPIPHDARIDNTAYLRALPTESKPAQTESMINIAPARKKVSFEDESLRQLEPPTKQARYDNIDFSGRFATRKKRRRYYDFSQPSRFST